MPWGYVQSASFAATGTGATTVSATYTSNVSSRTKLIAYLSGQFGQSYTSCVDNNSNSLTLLGSVAEASNGCAIYAMDTPADDVGTKPTLTATISPSASISMVIQEISGLLPGNTTAMIDASVAFTGFSSGTTTEAQPAYTTSVPYEFLVSLLVGNAGGSATQPTGYTADPNGIFSNGSQQMCGVSYKQSIGAAESGTWTLGTSGSNIIAVVAFKLAGVTWPAPQAQVSVAGGPAGRLGAAHSR